MRAFGAAIAVEDQALRNVFAQLIDGQLGQARPLPPIVAHRAAQLRVNRLVNRLLDLHFPFPDLLVENHVSPVAAHQRFILVGRHLNRTSSVAFGHHDLDEAHHVASKIHPGHRIDELPAVQVELKRALVFVVAGRPIHQVHGHFARHLVALVGVVSR